MDFAILLIHALGKVVWLLTYDWKFGNVGCKVYQFLSAFTYYGNSNLIVAIGIDRLIVVYTSHIQGATSKRRVRLLLLVTWLAASVCAFPQIFVWTSVEVAKGFYQCTTVWQLTTYFGRPSYANSRALLLYEMFHQSMVFWLPFLILLACYIFIIARVISYTFTGIHKLTNPSTTATGICNSGKIEKGLTAFRKPSLICLSSRLRLFEDGNEQVSNRLLLRTPSTDTLCVAADRRHGMLRRAESDLCYQNISTNVPRRFSANSECNTMSAFTTTHTTIFDSKRGRKLIATLNGDAHSLMTYYLNSSSTSEALLASSARGLSSSNFACAIQKSLTLWRIVHAMNGFRQKIAEILASCKTKPEKLTRVAQRAPNSTLLSRHLSQRQQKAVQIWKRQLRSRVFATSLAIVIAHCALWLPYNLLNSARFFDANIYEWAVANGGFLLEDLIVLNSVVNPILYGYENKWRICRRARL